MNTAGNIPPLIIFGASGHAKSVIDVVVAQSTYRILGLIDSSKEIGEQFFGCPILGKEHDLPRLMEEHQCTTVFVAIGENYLREVITNRLRNASPGLNLATLVHPSSVVSLAANISDGVVIMPGAVISADAKIGEGVIVNTSASVDHDSELRPYSSVAPQAALAGNVVVGPRTTIGIGASVSHKITIEADSVIGAGAAVVSDIPAGVVALGVPCRVVRQRSAEERVL